MSDLRQEVYLTRGTKCAFELYIDVDTKVIHILDLYEYGTTSVTNCIEEIQPKVLEMFEDDFSEFDWYLYSPGDGVVSLFIDGEFIFLEKDNEKVFQRFSSVI